MQISLLEKFHFSTDRKSQVCNLHDLFLFFKIKSIQDLKHFIPDDLSSYNEANQRLKNLFLSFSEFPIKLENYEEEALAPSFIWENIEATERLCYEKGMNVFLEEVGCENFLKVYNFFESFNSSILNKLQFQIKTTDGLKSIKLMFAENFRLKGFDESFNIFNLPKDQRSIIIPQDKNSKIFVADFKQFEFRTFLNLQNINHYFNHEKIYEEIGNDLKIKENAKESIISYLYGSRNVSFESFFKKNELVEKIENHLYWFKESPVYLKKEYEIGKKIHTIIQTISQYVYLKKLDKILNLLENKQSKFIFPHHDSVIISLSKDEDFLIDKIIDLLEDDVYKVKCYIGENYRDIIEI